MAARRRAASLVEVLVVVAILGLLAGLVIPAVQFSRESARRADCLNRQRNLGLAALQFEGLQRRFPGYSNLQAIDAAGQERPTGWVFGLLPFLETQSVYDFHGALGPNDSRGQVPNVALPELACPSDPYWAPKQVVGGLPATSYVANCGQPDVLVSPQLPPDWRANGVFMHRFGADAKGNRIRIQTVTADYLQSADGASRTLLLAENLDAGFWTDVSEANVGFVWEATLVDGRPAPQAVARINQRAGERWNGALAAHWQAALAHGGVCCTVCAGNPSTAPPPLPEVPDWLTLPDPQSPVDQEQQVANQQQAARRALVLTRPSSGHPGGVVVTFADGRAEFLSEDVDHLAYCRLMSSSDERASLPGTTDPVPAAYLGVAGN